MPGARLDRLPAAAGRIPVLPTADRDGTPNAAVFDSLRQVAIFRSDFWRPLVDLAPIPN